MLVVASIAIGVFSAGLIISIYSLLTNDMSESYQKINPANILINSPDFNQDFAKTIKRLPEVSDVQVERTFTIRMHVLPETAGEKDSWMNINVKAIPDFDKMSINRVILLHGSWPPKDKEIVFDQHKFNDGHISIGDLIEVKLPDGKLRQIPVIGLVQDESIGASSTEGGFFTSDLTGYVNFNTLEWLEQPYSANVLLARASADGNNKSHLLDIANLISKKFEDDFVVINNYSVRETNRHPNADYVNAMSGTLVLLGFLVVFLSGFLITNTLSGLLNQQMEQIGIIKSLGGSTTQIIKIYMVLILIFSAIGLFLALPTTGPVAYWLLGFLSQEVNFNLQGYREIPISFFSQIFIALIVPQVAGFFPIIRGSRITVQEALNGPTQVESKKPSTWNIHFSRLFHGLPRPIIISLRNTFRRKTRLILTLVTLTLGGAIFIATFNVQSSMNNFMVKLGNYFSADVTLDFSQPYHIQKIETILADQPNVSNIEGWAGAKAELLLAGDKPAESVNIMAPPINSKLVQPIILEGRWLAADDEKALVVNDNFKSRFPNLKIGDSIRMSVYGEKVNWIVVGIFQFAGKSSGLIGYANYSYLSKITHSSLRAASYQITTTQKGSTLDQQEAQGRDLEILFNHMGYQIVDMSTGQNMLASATNGLNILIFFFLIMAVLAAVVGSIGLTGTLSMNVLDRTREFAVMRAVGASDKAIMRLVIVEGLMIGTMSWILGSLLAFPISEMLWNIISRSLFDVTSNFTFNYLGFVLWMGVVLILSVAASVIPARSAAKLTIREALAYE